MLKKLFSIIFFFFSCFLILATLKNITFFKIIALGIAILTLLVLIRYHEKIKLNKNTINILIIVSIILRIGLLFFTYGDLYSDYANFYYCATNFAQNFSINKYIEVFPHLIPYIASLGLLFKVFGNSYSIVIILNIIFDLLAAAVLAKLFKSKKAALIWLLNPINIIWCGICHPTVMTNSFLIISIALLYKLVNKEVFNSKKVYLTAIIFAIALSIANLYRPVMIILIIAILAYFIIAYKQYNIKKSLIIFGIIISTYFLINSGFTALNKNLISDNITTKTTGWNIYVGSNTLRNGTWNTEQQAEFDELFYTDATPTEIQNYFFDKGITQYKNNGLKANLKLFLNKGIILVENIDELSRLTFDYLVSNKIPKIVLDIGQFISLIYVYILLNINLIIAYKHLSKKNSDFSNLLQLFIIGFVMAHLFVEVAVRYSLPLITAYTFLVIINKENILVEKKNSN